MRLKEKAPSTEVGGACWKLLNQALRVVCHDQRTGRRADDLLDRVAPAADHVAADILSATGLNHEGRARVAGPDDRAARAARGEVAALDVTHPDVTVRPDVGRGSRLTLFAGVDRRVGDEHVRDTERLAEHLLGDLLATAEGAKQEARQ